jgi:hypothetical protein
MTEWKLVPVEPTDAMMTAMESASDDWPRTTWQYAWQVALAAAPTPPVVLPPHDKRIEPWMYEYAEKYARAALAQYGIVDRQEDAA